MEKKVAGMVSFLLRMLGQASVCGGKQGVDKKKHGSVSG